MGAEQENAPLYSEVRAKGVYKVPFCPDLRFNECVWDIGISNFYVVGCHIVSCLIYNDSFIIFYSASYRKPAKLLKH